MDTCDHLSQWWSTHNPNHPQKLRSSVRKYDNPLTALLAPELLHANEVVRKYRQRKLLWMMEVLPTMPDQEWQQLEAWIADFQPHLLSADMTNTVEQRGEGGGRPRQRSRRKTSGKRISRGSKQKGA